jgi:hypothetical protein
MPNFYNIIRAKKFSTAADAAIEIAPYDSATPNFRIDAGGTIRWSSGSATADTNLYRSTPNTLKTDGSIEAATGLTAATPSFTGPLTSAGVSTFQNTVVLQQSLEKVNVGTSPSATTNIDVLTSAVHYYATSYSTGVTLEIRPSSSIADLNTLMSTNQSLTVVFIMKSGHVNGKVSALKINDISQTIKWFGGVAPSGSAGDALDAYTFTIIKTAASTYTVLGSQSKFA